MEGIAVDLPSKSVLVAKVTRQAEKIFSQQSRIEQLEREKRELLDILASHMNDKAEYVDQSTGITDSSSIPDENKVVPIPVKQQTPDVPPFMRLTKETVSSNEAKYQLLLSKHQKVISELQTVRSEFDNYKRSRRKHQWSAWDLDMHEERIRSLEAYVTDLETKDLNQDEKKLAMSNELAMTRKYAYEYREATKEAMHKLDTSNGKIANLEGILHCIAEQFDSVDLAESPEALLRLIEEDKKHQRILESLVRKAQSLLQTALRERDLIESIFKDPKSDSSSIATSLKSQHLHQSYPCISRWMQNAGKEQHSGPINERIEGMVQETNDAYQLALGTIERASDMLGIPQNRRAKVNNLPDALKILSQLVETCIPSSEDVTVDNDESIL